MPYNGIHSSKVTSGKKPRGRAIYRGTSQSSENLKDRFIYSTGLFKHYFKKKEEMI